MSARNTFCSSCNHCLLVGNDSALGRTASPTTPPPLRTRQEFMEADQQQQQDEWARSRHSRLPTFVEVLSRRTRPPVDLFMF